ncbi:MAG TPA: 30S ribosomal protein S6 [Chloroflexota bacterium]|nr:30S ribosomal protein S6 [Chloroflexota bacterium]
MRDYELMVVLTPELDDEAVASTTERIRSLVTTRGGEVVDVQAWGRRRLAYPIQKFRDGHYAVAKLKLSPDAAEPLDRSLKLTEPVIRHLLVRLDEPS